MYVRQLTALLAVFGAPEITPGLVICQGGLEDLAQSLNFDEALCVFFFLLFVFGVIFKLPYIL